MNTVISPENLGFDISKTLMHQLGMEFVKIEPDHVEARMPVDQRTHQPRGFLHGGASVALAESLASIGSVLNADMQTQDIFGVDINATHMKAKRDGWVTGVAVPVKIGRKTHVWQIDIRDESGAVICQSRCTIMVVDRR